MVWVMAKLLTKYKLALEKLGLKQLDVYRFKDKDIIRALTPNREVVVIELPRKREEMSIDEFIDHVKKHLGAK